MAFFQNNFSQNIITCAIYTNTTHTPKKLMLNTNEWLFTYIIIINTNRNNNTGFSFRNKFPWKYNTWLIYTTAHSPGVRWGSAIRKMLKTTASL